VLRQHKRAVDRGWRQPDADVTVNANVRMEKQRIVWGDGTVVADIEVPVPVPAYGRLIEHERSAEDRARIDAELDEIRVQRNEEMRQRHDVAQGGRHGEVEQTEAGRGEIIGSGERRGESVGGEDDEGASVVEREAR
jgi:hypothetical protein